MAVFFTADTHFGHERIIEHCNRPYASVREMDEDLIRRWNEAVGPDDTVYHLGDLTLGGPEAAQRCFSLLNGHVCVVPGGHDERWARPGRAYSTRSGPVDLLPQLVTVKAEGERFVLCHYPLREWEGSFHGVLHLYGHVHGSLTPLPRSLDVGVDVFPAPINAEEVVRLLRPAARAGGPTDGTSPSATRP